MKLLIVDDISTNRKLLRLQLEAEGLEVAEAADGVEALQALACEAFDAVVSDILMPRMDGYRLCHEVRSNPALQSLRFILYSSTYTSPSDVRLGNTVGADQFVAKPAPVGVILAALQIAHAQPRIPSAPLPDENFVLKEYSAALVAKLEEKNGELQASLAALQRAHDRIAELNAGLERRVAERTAALAKTNQELEAALANVKELSGLLPICCHCKKIRDDRNYWQSVEGYVAERTAARFTHGICPDCMEVKLAELDQIVPREGHASP